MDEGPYLETLYSLERESEDGLSPQPDLDFAARCGGTLPTGTISFSPHFSESTTVVAELDPFTTLKPLAELPYESLLGRASEGNHQNGVAFPLMQESEVRLMRYYIDYMCHWVSRLQLRETSIAYYFSSNFCTSLVSMLNLALDSSISVIQEAITLPKKFQREQ